jgi:hypothetical protein
MPDVTVSGVLVAFDLVCMSEGLQSEVLVLLETDARASIV